MKHIVIFGATSEIASELAKIYAAETCRLTLVARNQQKLSELREKIIAISSESVQTIVRTDSDFSYIPAELLLDLPDIVIFAQGSLTKNEPALRSNEYLLSEISINLVSFMSLITQLTQAAVDSKQPLHIVVFGSVAGDRARSSNYFYGMAKNALAFFLKGLSLQFKRFGIQTTLIKPGPTITPMTAHIQTKGLLFSSSFKVARCAAKAIAKKKSVAYCPGYWGLLMFIIKLLPEPIFKLIFYYEKTTAKKTIL